MKLTSQQEAEIYPLLDHTLTIPPGKGFLYPCTSARANYLHRLITGIKYNSAIESFEIYEPSDQFYGVGLYATIWTEPTPTGLILTNGEHIQDSIIWRFIKALALKTPVPIAPYSVSSARSRLTKLQKQYPRFRSIWINAVVPATIEAAEVNVEELVVVDIDTNPMEPLRGPTPEEIAKSHVVPRG